MNFDRDLAYSQIPRHLLVHLAGSHHQHHLLFSGGQRFKPSLNQGNFTVGDLPQPISLDGGYHRIKHFLMLEWLRQKIDRTPLHGANRHGNIAVSSHYDNGQTNTSFAQPSLELQSIHVGQPDVDYDTPRLIGEARIQKIPGRSVSFGAKSHRVKKAL